MTAFTYACLTAKTRRRAALPASIASPLTKSVVGRVPTGLTFILEAGDGKPRQYSVCCLTLLDLFFGSISRPHHHVPRLVLPFRPGLVRLLPLDLRLRPLEVLRVPILLLLVPIPRAAAEGEAWPVGQRRGGRVALAHAVFPGQGVGRPHHDILPHAAPRAPARQRIRPAEPPQAVLLGGGASGAEEVAGWHGAADCRRVRAHANSVCADTVDVGFMSLKYRYAGINSREKLRDSVYDLPCLGREISSERSCCN